MKITDGTIKHDAFRVRALRAELSALDGRIAQGDRGAVETMRRALARDLLVLETRLAAAMTA